MIDEVKIAMSWLFHISVYSRDQITDFQMN